MYINHIIKKWVLTTIFLSIVLILNFYSTQNTLQAATCYNLVCQDCDTNPHCGFVSCGSELPCDPNCDNDCADYCIASIDCKDYATPLECNTAMQSCQTNCINKCTKCCPDSCLGDVCNIGNCGSCAPPSGDTQTCRWKSCSSGTCISHSRTIPIADDCPSNECSTDNECTNGSSGTTAITDQCGINSAMVTAVVNGGVTPYAKYTWYKQVGSDDWSIDYEEYCPIRNSTSCSNSHTYSLSGQAIHAYLRVEDAAGSAWASNILNINCNNVCVNGTTQNCTTSSNCPGQQICANSTWGTCTDIPNDGCPLSGGCVNGSSQGCVTIDNCPGNQTCVNNTWNSCIDTPNDNCPAVSVCTIDSASVTPAYPKIIYLGGKFKVTWQTTDCSTCTITCNDLTKCGVNGLVQPVGDSGELEVKPTASGYYAYKITCNDGAGGGTSSIVLPSTDVWDGISPTLKTNIGAYRVRRPFIFETPAFLKLLIDKLF